MRFLPLWILFIAFVQIVLTFNIIIIHLNTGTVMLSKLRFYFDLLKVVKKRFGLIKISSIWSNTDLYEGSTVLM